MHCAAYARVCSDTGYVNATVSIDCESGCVCDLAAMSPVATFAATDAPVALGVVGEWLRAGPRVASVASAELRRCSEAAMLARRLGFLANDSARGHNTACMDVHVTHVDSKRTLQRSLQSQSRTERK